MKGHYGPKYDSADSRKYYGPVVIAVMLILIGIVGRCEYLEQPIEPLTQEQRVEIMSRQSDFDRAQNIDLADRILAARVERSWREGDK